MPFISSRGRTGLRSKKVIVDSGSLSFAGTTSSYLTIPNSVDFRFGTGDFTIEWYQYMTGIKSYPRVFQMGSFSGVAGSTQTTIGVSIESGNNNGTFYFWPGGPGTAIGFGSVGTIMSIWVHFAVSRSGTTLRVFKNGTQLGSNITNSTNFNDTTNPITIGNERSPGIDAAYSGLITNFHWVKGTALYTSNFTPPATPRAAVANSKLLLNAETLATATTDSSGTGKVVTNTGVTWNASNP
jgi:hypothetical protein